MSKYIYISRLAVSLALVHLNNQQLQDVPSIVEQPDNVSDRLL